MPAMQIMATMLKVIRSSFPCYRFHCPQQGGLGFGDSDGDAREIVSRTRLTTFGIQHVDDPGECLLKYSDFMIAGRIECQSHRPLAKRQFPIFAHLRVLSRLARVWRTALATAKIASSRTANSITKAHPYKAIINRFLKDVAKALA